MESSHDTRRDPDRKDRLTHRNVGADICLQVGVLLPAAHGALYCSAPLLGHWTRSWLF